MTDKKLGNQKPTQSYILPYSNTNGQEAIDLYDTNIKWCIMEFKL